jgi:hypothetical protein
VEIIIHQSLCGENSKKAWDLLQTTMPDTSIAKSIAFKADLQDQAGGVSWKPTIRGFMQDDYFLLMKTFPDKSPDVRPGRAFSHVLLISKKDIDFVVDIGSLFKYLPNEIEKSISLEPIKFNPKELSGITLPNGFQERFNKAIYGFKKYKDFKNTIMWVGEENFEQAIFRFWQVLSPSEKETVNIGIYFNVVAIPEGKLNFITTPENIESKFLTSGFCLIRRNDTQTLTDISEQFLAGYESAGQRIKAFKDTLETKQLSRTDIDKIAIVIKTFEEIDSTDDLKKLNSLSHVIAEFSPDEKKGIAFKNKLVDNISRLIENGGVTDIPLVKKFNFKSFKNSEEMLVNAINNWLSSNLFSVSETKKKDFSPLFRQLRESITTNWWTEKITERVKTYLSKINSESARVVFNWLQKDFETLKNIQTFIESSTESEKHFISQLPATFDKSNFAALKEFAVKRSWFKFHSTLLIQEHTFEIAIAEQLKVDTDYNYRDGLEIILNSVKPKAIIDFTVSNGDKRLIDISGKLCHEDSSQLEMIDFKNVYWQEVWLKSITNGNKILQGFKEPQKKIFKMFDDMIEGHSINQQLIEKIGDTEFGNILNYNKREALWSKFPSALQTKYLAKTSAALLESLSNDSTVEIPQDRILSDYIVKHAIGDFLYYNKNNIKSVLPIFYKFNQLSENSLKDYVSNYSGNIDVVDAIQLGKLVYSRSYSNVANTIHFKSSSYNNWKVALNECYLLLGMWEQMSLSLTGLIKNVTITEDQWWHNVEEIIVDLYQNQNSLVTIWKKAGGNEADLLMNTTPRNVWNNALFKLRQNKVKDISICNLLKEIIKDYKSNKRFEIIYSLRKSFIHC